MSEKAPTLGFEIGVLLAAVGAFATELEGGVTFEGKAEALGAGLFSSFVLG